MPARLARLGARHHLVPGAERGPLPVDEHLQITFVAGEVGPRSGAPHQLPRLGGEHDFQPLGLAGGSEARHDVGEPGAPGLEVGPGDRPGLKLAPQSRLDQAPALFYLERDLHAGGDLLLGVAQPAGEQVAPGHERVEVAARLPESDLSPPPVVFEEPHGHLVPGRAAARLEDEGGIDDVVAVAEDVGLDHERLTDCRFGREPATVDLGPDPLDGDATIRQRIDAVHRRIVERSDPGGGYSGGRLSAHLIGQEMHLVSNCKQPVLESLLRLYIGAQGDSRRSEPCLHGRDPCAARGNPLPIA